MTPFGKSTVMAMSLFLISGCSVVDPKCGANPSFAKVDSLLSIRDSEDPNIVFYHPDFADKLISSLCSKFGELREFTFLEVQSRFNRERRGAVYLPGNNQVFSFYLDKHSRRLRFKSSVELEEVWRHIGSVVRDNFERTADSLKNMYSFADINDAPLLRVTQLKDSSGHSLCKSFIIPFVPEGFIIDDSSRHSGKKSGEAR